MEKQQSRATTTVTATATQIEQLAPEARRALVEALARLEAAWLPTRHHWRRAGVIAEARKVGESGTVHWGKGGGERQRKLSQRIRGDLVDMGLLAHSAKLFDAKLTPEGKRLARSWSWPFVPADLAEAMRRIQARAAKGDALGDYVPETFIAGEPWGGDVGPFFLLERLLLPALAEGFVQSNGTTDGHTFYRLNNVESIPAIVRFAVGDAMAFYWELAEVYDRQQEQSRKAIINDHRRYCDLGEIPLPLSVELDSKRNHCSLRGIRKLFPAVMATT